MRGGSALEQRKEHIVRWAESQPTLGGGAYTREKENYSAKMMYNRLENEVSLLWIAEAVGVEKKTLVKAAAAAAAVSDYRSRPAAVRKIIPWEMITEHLCLTTRRTGRATRKA